MKRKYDRIWNANNFRKNTFKPNGKETIVNMFLGKNSDKEKDDKEKNPPIKGENVETEIKATLYEAFYGLEKKISLRTIDGNMKTFSVSIPEGIRDGEKIRLLGQGKPGKNGAKNGDLFIKVNIQNSQRFKLEGIDLYTDLRLTPWEAALGTRATISTIDDTASVYVPKGIESGEKVRIQGKGYKDGKGGRGDLIAEVKIIVPKELTNEEEKLYKELEQISNFNPRRRAN